ncbi:MAG: acyl-CoA dehydrogenase family protein [Burkholderiales bacterium]
MRQFRDTARKFIGSEFAPHHARWCTERQPDAEAWTKAGGIGLLLPDVPQEYGGGGGTFAHESVVLEELAQAGINFGASIQGIVAHYILAYGSEAQRQNWLPRMARGELVGAVAMTEPGAGSDLQGIKTTAHRDGGHYVVSGSKTFVTNGRHAGLVCLAVRTGATKSWRDISLLMLETHGLAGYQAGQALEKVGMHAQDTCELFFAEARVPASNLLGAGEGKGFTQMMEQLPRERLTVGVSAVAAMERALALTAQYVKQRTAFGKPLIDFQNTRFQLAQCTTEARVGRVFLDHCIERFVAGELDEVTAAMAKYWLTDSECRIVDECVQLHGGYGVMMEYPIARMWADSRAHRIYAGTNEIMKELIAWSL